MRIYGTVAPDQQREHIRVQSFAHKQARDNLMANNGLTEDSNLISKKGSDVYRTRNCTSNLTQYSTKGRNATPIEPLILPKFEKTNVKNGGRETESSEHYNFHGLMNSS